MLERIRMCLPSGAEVDLRMVYGVDALVAYGVPFVASHGGDLILRLDTESRDEALMLSGTTEWNPMGRGEADFVIVPGIHVATDDVLRYWIERAYEYAESLAAIEADDVHFDDDIDHFGHDDMSALSEMPPPSSRPKGGSSKPSSSPKVSKPAAATGRKSESAAKTAVKPAAKKAATKPVVKKAPATKKAGAPAKKAVKSAKPSKKAAKPARKAAKAAAKKSVKAKPTKKAAKPSVKKAAKAKATPKKSARPAARKTTKPKVSKKK